MDFGFIWRNWINGCFNSATSSVLINGSPSKEFSLERGLRQGDPWSPFLILVAAEALHVVMEEAIEKSVFKGIRVAQNCNTISHLQFADDVLFVGSIGDEKMMSWIKWSNVIAPKLIGGLGIGSLKAANLALLSCWWWRIRSDKSSLWNSVIVSKTQVIWDWRRPIRSGRDMAGFDELMELLCNFRHGTGENGWNFLLRGVEQVQYVALLDLVNTVNLLPMEDKWSWSLESSGEFSVAFIRRVIDEKRIIARKIAVWWNVNYAECNSYDEWVDWLASLRLGIKAKLMFEGTLYSLWWNIWTHRNKLLFHDKHPLKANLFDNVMSSSFYWCRASSKFTWYRKGILEDPNNFFRVARVQISALMRSGSTAPDYHSKNPFYSGKKIEPIDQRQRPANDE
nr:cysteine-rich receptor-like protein kinase [Tanacetum cinerariifolium]